MQWKTTLQRLYFLKGVFMSEENVKVAPQEEPPILKTKIGNTEYEIRLNFRPDAKETMSDKVKRMIKKDVENM